MLWFVGTAWSFFVFSCLYLTWRRVSFRHAYVAALVPHMLINGTVMAGVFLMASPNSSIERTSERTPPAGLACLRPPLISNARPGG